MSSDQTTTETLDVSSDEVDVSVVIGFKDWGRDRLLVSIRTIIDALSGVSGEVIVSDYGSADAADLRGQVEAAGARYVYTSTDGTWSRARALNAGFAVARGSVLISTDADMAFTPGSLATVCRIVQQDPRTAVVLQCRDLPPTYAVDSFTDAPVDWTALERAARLRPRWGMGGMMAVSAAAFERVRGFDERMVIYGGEDLDFAERLRRAGHRIHWIEDAGVRMYHIWHEPSRSAADATPEGREAIETNRRIYLDDKSVVRNTRTWRHQPAGAAAPATVVIATHNRADYVADSINSVLAQSMQDFELLVIDDGSTDHTGDVVRSFTDPRVRYVRQAGAGVAAARAHAAELTGSRYTVVHDDDDLMLPWRLESHFAALTAGVNGTYGGWVDFQDSSGALSPINGRTLSLGSILFAGKVYAHGTLMIETELLRRVGYDSSLRSGSDYNLGVRLMRAGVHMVHTGEYHIMRRLHDRQMTTVDEVVQKTSGVLSSFMARNGMLPADTKSLREGLAKATAPTVRGSQDLRAHVHRFLPDHLVRRLAVVRVSAGEVPMPSAITLLRRATSRVHVRGDSGDGYVDYVLSDVTWSDLAVLATARLDVTVHDEDSEAAQEILSGAMVSGAMRRLRHEASNVDDDRVLVVVRHTTDTPESDDYSGLGDLASAAAPVGGRPQGTQVVHTATGSIQVDAVTVDPANDLIETMASLGDAVGATSVTSSAPWTHEELAERLSARAVRSHAAPATAVRHLNGKAPA